MKLSENTIEKCKKIIGEDADDILGQLQLKDLSKFGSVYSILFEVKTKLNEKSISSEKIDEIMHILARDLIAFSFPVGANEFFKGQLIEQILTKVRSVSLDSFIILRSIGDYLITYEKNRFDLFYEYLHKIAPTKGDPIMQIENMIRFDIGTIVGERRTPDLIDLKDLLTSTKKMYYDYKKMKREEDIDINRYLDPNIWRNGKELGKIILSMMKKETL